MWHEYADWMAFRAVPAPPRLSPCDRAVVRARHPSFDATVAADLVASLPPRQLRKLWRRTGTLLDGRLDPAVRHNLVLLRARVLDRLEPLEP